MSLYIYIIELNENYYQLPNRARYDICRGRVIIASSPDECRELASKVGGDEKYVNLNDPKDKYFDWKFDNQIWKNSKYTDVKRIGIADSGEESGIVLTDFHNG